MIKEKNLGQFLVDWFWKSLQPHIYKDIEMMGSHTKEEEIFRAQQLDLIYSQSRILYQILANDPWEETGPTKVTPGPHADGVIRSTVN